MLKFLSVCLKIVTALKQNCNKTSQLYNKSTNLKHMFTEGK